MKFIGSNHLLGNRKCKTLCNLMRNLLLLQLAPGSSQLVDAYHVHILFAEKIMHKILFFARQEICLRNCSNIFQELFQILEGMGGQRNSWWKSSEKFSAALTLIGKWAQFTNQLGVRSIAPTRMNFWAHDYSQEKLLLLLW